MEKENGCLRLLKRYRYSILLLMVAASLLNALIRFIGEWGDFWTALMLQAWFGQAVFAYLRGGWVAIGPGAFPKTQTLDGELCWLVVHLPFTSSVSALMAIQKNNPFMIEALPIGPCLPEKRSGAHLNTRNSLTYYASSGFGGLYKNSIHPFEDRNDLTV